MIKESPCKGCNKSGGVCEKCRLFKTWVRESWREIQRMFGVEPKK